MEPATLFHPAVDVALTQHHQRQQSQDSGAFIDWNSEDSGSPTGLTDEFVTVVSVESKEIPSPFVTVLEIGDDPSTQHHGEYREEVLVYRLPGERLGFGLKFEGGQNTAEKVRRLFIQSSAPDSPASRAKCSWGSLVEGDEIIEIDGHAVNGMTRLDCVRCLKESNVVIKLVIRHPAGEVVVKKDTISISTPTVISAEMKKRSPPPPPIPPRKVPRKSPALPPREDLLVQPPDSFEDDSRQLEPLYSPVPRARSVQPEHKTLTRVPSNPKDFVDLVKGVVRRNSLRNIPPEAEVYLDLIAHEDEIRSNWGSESDDTASTISTIVGMPTNNNSLCDLPFDSVNGEFLFSKLNGDKEPDSVSCDDRSYGPPGDDGITLQPPLSFQDAPLSYGNEDFRPSLELKQAEDELFMSSLKNYPEDSLDEVDLSLEASIINEKSAVQSPKKTSLIPRLAKTLGLLSPPKPSPRKEIPEQPQKPRSNKKRPPPPPPPSHNEHEVPAETQTKSIKSSIPYLKKKKSKDDDRKATKLEKKSKKEKLTEKEEGIVPYFEPSSPEEEDDEVKLCWPVPELPRDGSPEMCEVFPPEQNMDFGVEAVTSLFSWGSHKQLETIGEDEEEVGEEEVLTDRCVSDQDDTLQVVKALDTPSETSVLEAKSTSENCSATLDFLNEERQLSSSQLCSSVVARDSCGLVGDCGQGSAKVGELVVTKGVKGEVTIQDDGVEGVVRVNDSYVEEVRVKKGDFDREMVVNHVEFVGEVVKMNGDVEGDVRERKCDVEEEVVVKDSEVILKNGDIERKTDDLNEESSFVEDEVDIFAEDVENVTALEDSAARASLNEEPEEGHSTAAPSVVPAAALPPTDGELKKEMDAVAAPPLGSSFPAPPFSRMPPDGHEFPQKYREEMPGKIISNGGAPPLPASEPPRKLELHLGKGKPVAGWRQDERSVKSVRDKIAMFQSVPDAPVSPSGYTKLSKFKSSEDVLCEDDDRCLPETKAFSRSVLSMDKVGGGYSKNSYSSGGDSGGEFGGRTQSTMDLTSSSSSAYSSSCSPDSSLSSTTSSYLGYSSTLPRKMSSHNSYEGKTGSKAGVTRTSSFNIHNRSQSMLDINPVPFGKARDDDSGKQTSLNSIVEQRRKNMTKLRGLVIPEKSTEIMTAKQSILDLPEIKSRDLILPSKHIINEKERRTSVGCYPPSTVAPSTNLLSPPWKTQSQSPAIPKYSPAFKRKSISVYGASKNDYLDRYKSPSLSAPSKPPRYNGISPRYSFDSSRPLLPDSTSDYGSEKIQRHSLNRPTDFPKSIDFYSRGKGRCEEDSDNDSAVSSSRSSISPPASPLLGGHQALSPSDIEKTPLARTLSSETTASGTSTTSTLTSGSHASFGSDSDSHGKRILKPQSVEAINRKNVLTSAKYSRGFDGKLGSPLIQRKMLEELLASKAADEVDYTEMYLNKHTQGNNNNSNGKDIVCYTLAENYKSLNRVPDVKIAFLNHVECPDESLSVSKIDEIETAPFNFTVPHPVPRRVSVPTYTDSAWNHDSTITKTDSNGHIPLTPTMSSESIRSRASSADTIVERPIIMEAEIVPSRLRTLQSETVSESEGSLIDDTAESGPEDNSPRFSTARSSTGSESVSSGWSYRASDAADSSGEFTVPLPRSSRPSIDNEQLLRKRGSSGSLLDGFDDVTEPEKRNGRVTSERINSRNRRSVSVNDIRKAFEKADAAKAVPEKVNGNHARVSSLDSTTSDDSGSNLHREQFGSITSLASSTSLISPQELQSLIDEANLTLEEATGGTGAVAPGSHDVLVVILHRDSVGGSVGITLAGGADYESKEITVHKVLAGSPADRDGRIQKGDRVLSINGRSMKGCTHRESLAILKAPRPEVVLVISRLKSDLGDSSSIDDALTSGLRASLNGGTNRPPRIIEGSLLNEPETVSGDDVARGPPAALQLTKDGAGLGFSLEGGKDSPLGDKPLVVKKIFTGGAAEKSGLLKAGDQILNVNGVDVSQMSRIEAWKLMKRLPDGNVAITIRRVVDNAA